MKFTILFDNPELPDMVNPCRITRDASSIKEAKKLVPKGCKFISATSNCESGVCEAPVSDEEE